MSGPIAELDFFPKLLTKISDAFAAGDTCIVECVDSDSGEKYKVLALVQLNETNRMIQFYPIARLYDSNPMERVKIIRGTTVLASQIPISRWIELSKEKPYNPSNMN